MYSTIYMPIDSTSLAHYFGGACILPAKYYVNKPKDIQDILNGVLLLSIHKGTKQTNCCLELVLSDLEKNDLIELKNGFYAYEKPLPITRVKQILFSSNEQKNKTVTNIRMSTAFVPEALLNVVPNFEQVDVVNLELPQDMLVFDYTPQKNNYDRILGGLAVMKVAHNDYMNYSENYFSTVGYFNEKILEELKNANVLTSDKYCAILVDEYNKLHKYLYEPITDELVEKVAAEENQTIARNKITKVIELNALKKNTYVLAVLNTYGLDIEAKKKKVADLFLSHFVDGLRPEVGEGIAICYGISRGYSSFPMSYLLSDKRVDVKYKLNTLLDYYTIESVYQFVYNGVKSSEFQYFDWVPRCKQMTPRKSTDYIILDEYVIGKKKPRVSGLEYLRNLLRRFFSDATSKHFESFVDEIRNVVYADTKNEVEEDYIDRMHKNAEEVNIINSQMAKEVAVKQQEIDALKLEIQQLKSKYVEGYIHEPSPAYGMLKEKPNDDKLFADIEDDPLYGEVLDILNLKANEAKDKAKEEGVSSKGKVTEIQSRLICKLTRK